MLSTPSPHREQILATATRLFFEQGYTITGVNQIIAESSVARQTFYHHFPSKEALCAAYLDARGADWIEALRRAGNGRRSARGVARGLFGYVEELAIETHFRGCGMLNMASEFADAGSAVRERVRVHKSAQRALMRELFLPFGVDGPLTDQIHVLVEGAIAGAASLLNVEPIHDALKAAEGLLKKAGRDERR
ncbi:MAG: TetR/AcrR family transcriptional regulator [Bradyrhizobium sp.]|nr:MAG: TetR/AcrR family transcriptional regulator [Bradyrhizobium sp.]